MENLSAEQIEGVFWMEEKCEIDDILAQYSSPGMPEDWNPSEEELDQMAEYYRNLNWGKGDVKERKEETLSLCGSGAF